MEKTTEKPLDMKTEMSLQINEHTEFQVGYIKQTIPGHIIMKRHNMKDKKIRLKVSKRENKLPAKEWQTEKRFPIRNN